MMSFRDRPAGRVEITIAGRRRCGTVVSPARDFGDDMYLVETELGRELVCADEMHRLAGEEED